MKNNRLGRGSRGPPKPPVGPGQSPGRVQGGKAPTRPKTNWCIFTCLRKALHESRLFIFIIQKSCQILEIIDFGKNNIKKKKNHQTSMKFISYQKLVKMVKDVYYSKGFSYELALEMGLNLHFLCMNLSY